MKNLKTKITISKITAVLIYIMSVIIFFAGCTKSPDIVVIEDSSGNTNKVTGEDDDYKIYLITMDLADDFWKSIDSGCRRAVAELGGIDYKWTGPDTNEDDTQMICIDQAVAEGADAILLAASSPNGVNESLRKAAEAGVKIIYVDNAANFDCIAFLATNNELAGVVAGETLQKGLSDAGITSGIIGISANKANVTSTALRIKGFRKSFEGTNFTLDDTFFMEDNDQSLKDFAAEHPEYVAFFGPNERTALALGEQMKSSGSKQIVMGFDTSDAVLALMYDGVLYATLQQNPQAMGYDGIKIAVETLKGNYTETNVKIDTGVNVLNKDSI